MTYQKRWPVWTPGGAAALGFLSDDEAAQLDDELQDRWAEQDAAEAQERADRAERRRLNITEQRLRVNDRLERLKRRRARGAGAS